MKIVEKLLGFWSHFGVKTVTTVDEDKVPQIVPEKTHQCPPSLLDKMRKIEAKREGVQEMLSMMTQELGSIFLEERAVWDEIHAELGIPKNIGLVLNRETGVIREARIKE